MTCELSIHPYDENKIILKRKDFAAVYDNKEDAILFFTLLRMKINESLLQTTTNENRGRVSL